MVGLLSIEIFGYQNPACREYAVHLGKALQLTNILRDVRTDAERGRIYLPLAELKQFNVTEAEILRHEYSDRFARLAASVAARARNYYRLARETLPAGRPPRNGGRRIDGLGLLAVARANSRRKQFNVLGPEPTRLSKPQKLALILQTWIRFASGAMTPNYGTP